jgi:chromosome segregation ATPase
MTNKNDKNVNVEYGYYSKLLKEPFDSLNELTMAEEAYYAKQKAKEDAAAQKKADAKKVEEAFKALNAARKEYKEKLTQLTKEYSEELENLRKAYELGKQDMQNKLAEAEQTYKKAIKDFGDKYPEGYHMTLKDGDFETTISHQTTGTTSKAALTNDLWSLFFGW